MIRWAPSITVVRNDREITLHHNMLFPLGLWNDIGSILMVMGESEISGNPAVKHVDNFPIDDGEVDQPVYEGPQTQSHTKQLMKANILMDRMFDIQSTEVCEEAVDIMDLSDKPAEPIKDLILQFWYQQLYSLFHLL